MIHSKYNPTLCIGCKNSRCFIKLCSPEWQQYASERKITNYYRERHSIFTEGEPVSGLYFISHGKVKISASCGKEQNKVIRFSKDGDIIGHRGFGSKYKCYIISATAMEDTKICFFESKLLYELMEANVKLTIRLMEFYAEDLLKTEMRMSIIAQKSVRERLAITLLELYNLFGTGKNESKKIQLNLSRQEMADYVGTTRENVSKFLSEFASDGYIALSGQEVSILNNERLFKVSNAEKYDSYLMESH